MNPHSEFSAKPASVRLPDEIVRKQQALRRHLQDPSSPAFNDPVRAAELAGFRLKSRPSGEADKSSLFRNIDSVSDTIEKVVSLKAARIEELRRRVSAGMDATRIVTVYGRDGARQSVEVPDEVARSRYTRLYASIENLLPSKASDLASETLPHEASRAAGFERVLAANTEDQVSCMSSADRFQVSHAMLRVDSLRQRARRVVAEAKLGKPIEEFEKEVEQEADRELFCSPIKGESQGTHHNEGGSSE